MPVVRNLTCLLAGVDAWWNLPHLESCHELLHFAFHISLDGYCDLGVGDIHGPNRQRARVLKRVLDQIPVTLATLHLQFEVSTWAYNGVTRDLQQIDWHAFRERLLSLTSLVRCSIELVPSDEVGDAPTWTHELAVLLYEETQLEWEHSEYSVEFQ